MYKLTFKEDYNICSIRFQRVLVITRSIGATASINFGQRVHAPPIFKFNTFITTFCLIFSGNCQICTCEFKFLTKALFQYLQTVQCILGKGVILSLQIVLW